jgi:glutaredoxin-like YruB-family protein
VIVYTTDVCPWCTRVKAYLRQNAIPFREINVQRDQSAARRMVERSGQQGVPQLDIDGRVVVGFDKTRIDSLLGIHVQSA